MPEKTPTNDVIASALRRHGQQTGSRRTGRRSQKTRRGARVFVVAAKTINGAARGHKQKANVARPVTKCRQMEGGQEFDWARGMTRRGEVALSVLLPLLYARTDTLFG